MKSYFQQVATQVTSILIAAAAAAGIAFIQALASKAGACPGVVASPETAAFLGGSIKLTHSAFTWPKTL